MVGEQKMSEIIEEYLFCWDEIPGKDSDKLIEFLRDQDVKWVKKAKIEKVDNGNAIKIFNEKKSLLLKLNNERTEASLEMDDGIWEFIVKEENGKLNIYEEIGTVTEEDLPKLKRVHMGTEEELIKFIRENPDFNYFWQERLKEKIEWEKEGWNLLHSNVGKINPEILNTIFDIFGGWWGHLLKKPARNRIFSTPNDKLNNWFNYLLNGNEPEPVRIEKCIVDPEYKVNGAAKGLVTLLLYLKNPNSFNVMMDPTIAGLEILGRFDSKIGKRRWRDYYNDYNTAANEFKDRFKLEPQSIDWVLDVIHRNYKRNDEGNFYRLEYEEDNKEGEVVEAIPNKELVMEAIFKQAIKELGLKEGRYIDDVILKMKQIANDKGEQLQEDWEEKAREKIKNEWASNKPDK